jgi:hypothetical protein
VVAALHDHYYKPDIEAARAFYACLAAHDLPGQPVWPMLVAPPGCGKSEAISPLKGLSNVHLIDSITPNTLISGRVPEPGKEKGKDGLLERLGDKATILISDFSTVLSGNREKRAAIFAQLRCVYDGRLHKEFGVENLTKPWEGRITLGVAVTPEVDRHTAVFGALGERFVQIRWRRIGGVEAALTAMDQDLSAKVVAMRTAVHNLFDAMRNAPIPGMPEDIKRAIASVAEVVARGRTPIQRERDDSVDYVPESEGATRLAQQLCQLAKGSARLEGRAMVDATDLAVVHRVAFDTMPPKRAAVLRALMRGESAEASGLALTTRKRALEDLEMVGLIDNVDDGGPRYRLRPDAVRWLVEARLMSV